MLMKERISRQQMMWLYANGLLGASLLILPQVLAASAKQDGWITSLICAIGGLLLVLLYITLALRFPGQTIVEYITRVLGRPIGLLALAFYLGYIAWLVMVMQREIVDFFSINYPETPIEFTAFCFALITMYIILGGLEAIARVNDLLFPIIVTGVLVLTLLAIPEYMYSYLKPLLPESIMPILGAIPTHISFPYGNAVVFLMIFPFIRNNKDLPYAAVSGSMMGSAVITMIVLFSTLTLGAATVARVVYPPHFAARTITILSFLAGLDGLVDVIWITSNVLRIAVFQYALVLAVSQLLGLSSYRYLVIPLVALMSVGSLNVYRSMGEQIEFNLTWTPLLSIVPYLLVPLLVLVVAMVRKVPRERKPPE